MASAYGITPGRSVNTLQALLSSATRLAFFETAQLTASPVKCLPARQVKKCYEGSHLNTGSSSGRSISGLEAASALVDSRS